MPGSAPGTHGGIQTSRGGGLALRISVLITWRVRKGAVLRREHGAIVPAWAYPRGICAGAEPALQRYQPGACPPRLETLTASRSEILTYYAVYIVFTELRNPKAVTTAEHGQ